MILNASIKVMNNVDYGSDVVGVSKETQHSTITILTKQTTIELSADELLEFLLRTQSCQEAQQ